MSYDDRIAIKYSEPIKTEREIFTETFLSKLELMKKIATAKNSDYTGLSDDPFANFRLIEKLGVTSAETGIIVRMTDKISRVLSLLQKNSNEVKDESISDTLLDLANYSIILSCMIEMKGKKNEGA